MLKRTILALAIALPSMALIGCGDKDTGHVAITPKQKAEQGQENIQEMNIISDELLAAGFPLFPVSDALNGVVQGTADIAIQTADNAKLEHVQERLQRFIALANETVKYDNSSKVEVQDVDKVKIGLENATKDLDAINKELDERTQAGKK